MCANCGKGEEESDKLKVCTACKMVKYCNRDCQIAHRPQHKKACRIRAAELVNNNTISNKEELDYCGKSLYRDITDEELFKQPPQKDDCPICCIRLPSLGSGSKYKSCCGKMICSGCSLAPVYDNRGNVVAKLCPFCRTLFHDSDEEQVGRVKKRVETNDSAAIYTLGYYYFTGLYGVPQDYTRALELYHRAGDDGYAQALCNIGYAYQYSKGVEKDMKKAIYYYKLAAICGEVVARNNLGILSLMSGNFDNALKHFMIAAECGCAESLKYLKEMYSIGDATKDDYTEALQAYQVYLDEIKSEQRDIAGAADEKYRCY